MEQESPGRCGVSTPVDGVDVLGALSPSRAGDFMTCPLLYRFRTIDRLPEPPSPTRSAAPSCTRCSRTSSTCPPPSARPSRRAPCWRRPGRRCSSRSRSSRELFGPRRPRHRRVAGHLPRRCSTRYFTLEDPRRLEPAERELYVEALLDSKLLLRGFVDRIDVAPDGAIRVVDYKSGSTRRDVRGQGAVPDEVLRPGHLAHPRRRPRDAAAGLPRQRARSCATCPTRPTCWPPSARSRPSGGRSGWPRSPATGAPTEAGSAPGAPTRPSARPGAVRPRPCRSARAVDLEGPDLPG